MATATSAAEILLYGTIGPGDDYENAVTDRQFVSQLESLADEPEIHVRINSGGGSVTQGLAMHSAMMRARSRGQQITTWNDGAAFSMAAILMQAGTTRIVADNSLTMLHNPYTNTGGNAAELRKTADVLDKTAAELVAIVSARAKQPKATVSDWLAKESWFDAREAVAFGLADKRYTDSALHTHSSRLAAENIFAKYKVPARYRVESRAPIEAALEDIEVTSRVAIHASYWGTYKSFEAECIRACEALTHMPGASHEDIARAYGAMTRMTATRDYTRKV